ncbi:pullulanase [Alteromonas sp. I4]|nr:pullulanase [Alteromonas sp. I4]
MITETQFANQPTASGSMLYKIVAALLVVFTLTLTGCGGTGTESGTNDLLVCDAPLVPDSTGMMCVEKPPIDCDPPTVPNETNDACVIGADPTLDDPVFFPGDDQAVLYYNRAGVGATNSPGDSAYEGWKLHTWNNDACDAYADGDTDWANGRAISGIDPNYGAYWVLELKPGVAGTPGACHNFIIHKGTDDAGKEMGGSDFKGKLDQDDEKFTRMNFTLSGVPTVFEFPLLSLGPQPVKIEGASAHWLDTQVILWDAPDGVETINLHYSAAADLETSVEDGLNGTAIELTPTSLTDEQIAIAPHLASIAAYEGDWSADDAKAVLKTQVVAAGYASDGTLLAATRLQHANVLDQLYTKGEDDADEAVLGGVYTDDGITAAVWAPTATTVNLLVYNDNKTLADRHAMTLNTESGVWVYNGDMSLDRKLYRYEVTVYHPSLDDITTLEVTDPYSVSLTTNGRFSRFVNLADESLKPDGWDTQAIPEIENPEDAVIYEGHVRDFSIRDMSTSEANRGKYLAFTEQGSDPVSHLQELADAGLTHFHILPSNDIATIDEDPANTVDIYDTVARLCVKRPNAQVCSEADPSSTLLDVYNSYDPLSEAGSAQALTQELRSLDSFNWGYDPHHFNAPEGSYASSAEGVERIVEMRAMIQSLHEIGLRVALDVVYNHTNASGIFTKSVLDKVVPGYYHRYEVDSGAIVRETCCEDTEPRNVMMEKLMLDSLSMWASEYKFDAFRFDIMSQATKDTMVRLRDAIQAIDPDNYFYGEGWTKIDRGYEQANQLNMAGTEIGTYNDRLRDAIRYGHIFNPDSDSALYEQDRVKMGMAGTLADFVLNTSGGRATTASALGGYAQDPADIINYISKHDNETLWDQLNYVLPEDLTLEQRVRAQNAGMGITLLSQGIPFLQMGGDMLRSKSMDRDSYDSGDWFNFVDFTMQTNNWNVGLPLAEKNEARWGEMGQFVYSPERAATMTEIEMAAEVFKEFLTIRQTSPLFRLTTAQDIMDRVGFHNLGTRQQVGLIAMSIDDGINADAETPLVDLDANYDAVMVVANTGYEEKSIEVNTATGFMLHSVQQNSYDSAVRGAYFTENESGNGTFTVPALTIAVFVKPQSGAQGYGLATYATAGAPDVVPYGDTSVYLRGSMSEWGTSVEFAYQGNGIYTATSTLTAGTQYEFKFASEDWATVNFGAADAADAIVTDGVGVVLGVSNNNLFFTPSVDATYLFTVDASDAQAPVLTVENEEPYAGTTVYLRGGFNGWGTETPLEYKGARQYQAAMSLTAGSYEFKVASEDWATVNLGAMSGSDEDKTVVIGQETYLAATNDNLVINIDADGDYVFIVDVSDKAEPVLKVFNAQFFGATPVYLRGGMNGWGTADELVYQGAGVYSVDITVSGGATEFKVASEDWATINLGNPDDALTNTVTVGVGKVLGSSNNNLMIELTAGTYEFRVTGPDATQPILTVIAK